MTDNQKGGERAVGRMTRAAQEAVKAMQQNEKRIMSEELEDLKRSDEWRIADMQRIILELKRELASEAVRRHDLEQRIGHLEESFTRHRRRHATEPDLSYMG